MIRLAAAFVILGGVSALAVLLDTQAGTAIVFSFAGHMAVAAGIGLYVVDRVRPVRLSDDERSLYELAFQNLSARSFLEFVALGSWRDADAGDRLFAAGQELTEILILLSGSVSLRAGGETLGELGPGQLVGAAVALTGSASWGDAVVEERCRYLARPLDTASKALAKKPETRAALNNIVSRDLADKLRSVTAAGPESST